MADLGLTELEAVNEILRAIGEPPAAALDTDGNGEVADAERALDTESRRVQMQEEWPECVDYGTTLTASGGVITVPSTTLWIRGIAPKQFSNITVQGDSVYDMNRHTVTFVSATQVIYLDIGHERTFLSLSPPLKDLIVAEAARVFARRKMGGEIKDAQLTEERTRTDIAARRFGPQTEHRPTVTGPVAPQASQQRNG